MDTLDAITMPSGGRLELCLGDLSAIGPEDACDLIVISAFPHDYTPTAGSLVGALHRRGLSVGALAHDPEFDLRASTSCWISRAMHLEVLNYIDCREADRKKVRTACDRLVSTVG